MEDYSYSPINSYVNLLDYDPLAFPKAAKGDNIFVTALYNHGAFSGHYAIVRVTQGDILTARYLSDEQRKEVLGRPMSDVKKNYFNEEPSLFFRKDSSGKWTSFRPIHSWNPEIPDLYYSLSGVDVYFYDSKNGNIEIITNSGGIDDFKYRRGFFCVEESSYLNARRQMELYATSLLYKDNEEMRNLFSIYCKLAPYMPDYCPIAFFRVAVPVHDNSSGQSAPCKTKGQSDAPMSIGVLFDFENYSLTTLYVNPNSIDSGHDYHLGLREDQLTSAEIKSLLESLIKDIDTFGRLECVVLDDVVDDDDNLRFDVIVGPLTDNRLSSIAEHCHCFSINSGSTTYSFSDFDDAVLFCNESLCLLQEKRFISNNLSFDSPAVKAVVARITDPVARSFSKEQVSVINDYLSQSDSTSSKLVLADVLFSKTLESNLVSNKPLAWKEDVRSELYDLAKGVVRDESMGMRL